MKANRVEEDIEKASKVGKQVKWQVLDIKFGKQAKKNLMVKSLKFPFCLHVFLAHSFLFLSLKHFKNYFGSKICRKRPWGSRKKPKEVHFRRCWRRRSVWSSSEDLRRRKKDTSKRPKRSSHAFRLVSVSEVDCRT